MSSLLLNNSDPIEIGYKYARGEEVTFWYFGADVPVQVLDRKARLYEFGLPRVALMYYLLNSVSGAKMWINEESINPLEDSNG